MVIGSGDCTVGFLHLKEVHRSSGNLTKLALKKPTLLIPETRGPLSPQQLFLLPGLAQNDGPRLSLRKVAARPDLGGASSQRKGFRKNYLIFFNEISTLSLSGKLFRGARHCSRRQTELSVSRLINTAGRREQSRVPSTANEDPPNAWYGNSTSHRGVSAFPANGKDGPYKAMTNSLDRVGEIPCAIFTVCSLNVSHYSRIWFGRALRRGPVRARFNLKFPASREFPQ